MVAERVFANWWRRAAAALVDTLLSLGVTFAAIFCFSKLFFVFAEDARFGFSTPADEYDLALFTALLLVGFSAAAYLLVLSLFYALVMVKTNGQTFGKWLFGIRVVAADGGLMTMGFALKREALMKPIVLFLSLCFFFPFIFAVPVVGYVLPFAGYLLDCLLPLWDSESRALHDRMSCSHVVFVHGSSAANKD